VKVVTDWHGFEVFGVVSNVGMEFVFVDVVRVLWEVLERIQGRKI